MVIIYRFFLPTNLFGNRHENRKEKIGNKILQYSIYNYIIMEF